MTKAYVMNGLVEKMQSPDQDFRYMGLNDLMNEIKQDPTSFLGEEPTENKVLHQVLSLVEDKISEVKNQAVKCLGVLIKIIKQSQMEIVVDKLIDFSSGKDEELRDISALALKTVTSELPLDSKIAPSACAKLTPKLLAQVSNPSTPPEALVEALSILSILTTRFPIFIAASTGEHQPLTAIAPLLTHARPVVRKRAIVTLSQLAQICPTGSFDSLIQKEVLPFLDASTPIERYRTTVQFIAALARQAPIYTSPYLSKVVPGVIAAAQKDDEELREGSIQALESFVLRCQSEIAPYLTQTIQVGTNYISYDPNYAGGDDDDEEMGDAEDEDEDDGLDEYSDDEDTSYKIRRSATKLLSAIISTRPELLIPIYKDISPVLIARFGDREENVKLEVWNTYAVLLRQTIVYGGLASELDITGRGKRKRDADETMDVEEGPHGLLKSQVPSLAKNLLNQLKSMKTPSATLQAGFNLLHTLVGVLPGCLATQAPTVLSIAKAVLSQPPTTSNSSLHLTCLSFLSLFFSTHPHASFNGSLSGIIPALLKSLAEKHPRISSETFRVFSSLLQAAKPVKDGEWVDKVYEVALSKVSAHDTDAEVVACAQNTIADLWICANETMQKKDRKEWTVICKTTGKTDGAVKAVTKVATQTQIGDDWVNGCVEWLMNLLKKSGKTGKAEIFTALEVLLRSYSSQLPGDLTLALVPLLKPYVTTADISLLSHALNVSGLLLELSPSSAFPEIEREILSDIYRIAHSPLVSGPALDSLLNFFGALVSADNQIANHVIPNLAITIEKSPKSEAQPLNVAKCIAQVVKSQQAVAAGTIAEYSKRIKAKSKTSSVVLSLLILGELGRFIDMSPQGAIFTQAIEYFSAEEEEVRTAAAFCAGNVAIGNLHQFLPALVSLVQSDLKKRLLALHALKEVVTHCSHGQLEGVADTLWTPLFQNSENAEEAARNVAAACLGKLATTHPSRYLPQLHARIRDSNPASRATVVAAIRYTLGNVSQTYDELLAPLLADFLSLTLDEELNVRRVALSCMNSAARTKPQLIRDHLDTLLPSLYKETVVRPELIRTVQMGPWTHKVDDGLETRKTAFETMYTLLDSSLSKLDLHEFIGRVITGLSDDSDEVKVICHMILFRLSQVAPAAVSSRLDEIVPKLEASMKGATVTKDTVKQDLERAAELQKSTLRAVAALSKVGTGISAKLDTLVEDLHKGTWANDFKELVEAK